jgi:hypothetical protein
MPKEVEKIARKQKMQTVADVMQSLDILQIPMSTPIKINQERKLSDLLGELPESIAALEIESVSELMQDKKAIGLLNAQDKDALQIFSLLNRSVRSIPSINQKWLPKLEENGVLRIWQYITEDPVTLADYCGTSVKAQEDYKEKLSLNKIAGSEVKFPTQFKKDIDLFSKYGVYTLQELVSEGFMAGYVESNEEFSTKLSSYKAGLMVPIHHTVHFWTLDPTSREDLAKMGVTLSELREANSELTQGVLLDALKENLRDGQALDEWLDPKELKSLAKQGVSTVEDWIFRNIRGEIDPTSASFKKFRSTLDLVPDLPIKQIVNGYQNGITHISDILLEDEKELAKKLKTTANKIVTFLDTMKEGNYFSPQLPNLGLVSTSIVEAMREGGITSWAQILGNARKEEIELVKGITWNTVLSVREYANVPLWHSTEIRTLGVKTLRKLVADGVTTIADVLVLGDKFRDFLKDEKLYTTILDNLSRANLRKGAAMISIRLSESYKIRVKDIEAYEKAGILSPMDILIQNYDVAKNSPLIDGIDDWLRIGDYDLEEINFPMKVITKLKSVGIKKVQDAILAPDKLLRDAGATNHQIKAFRKDLNRLKKGDKRVV